MLHALNALLFIAVSISIGRALLPAQNVVARSRGEEFAVAYTLGLATIVVLCNVVFVIGLNLGVAVGLSLVAGSYALYYQRQRSAPFAHSSLTPIIGYVILAIGALSLIATIAYPINEFDAIYHWAYRGKILLFNGSPLNEAITGIISDDNFGRVVTHPNYPLGVPIIEAFSAYFSGWSDRWVQLPLGLWAASMPWLIAFGLRGLSQSAIKVSVVATVATPILYVTNFTEGGLADLISAGTSSGMMLGGGADLAVMCMLTLSAALFLRAINHDCKRLAITAGIALAATAAMKNEGLAMLIVCLMACGLALVFKKRPILRIIGFFATSAILCVAPWLGIRAQIPAIDENYSEQLTVENFMHFAGGGLELVEKSPLAMSGRQVTDSTGVPTRRSLVAAAFFDEFTDVRSWGLLWLLAAISMGLVFKNIRCFNYRWLTLVVMGGVLLYFLILLVTPWNFPSLRDKGIPERLLVHLVGPIMLLIGHCLSSLDLRRK
ncbi:MAG: hypothetical protein ACI81F_000594 [Thalassolituus oleivorans]|jgi:hypothetical protein